MEGVVKQDADAGLGGDLGDAATHGAGADDTDASGGRLRIDGHGELNITERQLVRSDGLWSSEAS
jgi:hypothetical protein